MSRLLFGALVLGSSMMLAAAVRAEEVEQFAVEASSPVNPNRPPVHDDSWYYHPTTEPTSHQPNPEQIIQAKAMARSQQRSSRLASSAWYGMSNGRPIAVATPFCSPVYSPAWQSPYGGGFSWRQGQPTYIVTGRPSYVLR